MSSLFYLERLEMLKPLFDKESLDLLTKALKDREDFFKNLPEDRKEELLVFQDEIEDKLKKAGNSHNRLVVLQEMMREHLELLGRKLSELGSKLTHFKGEEDDDNGDS